MFPCSKLFCLSSCVDLSISNTVVKSMLLSYCMCYLLAYGKIKEASYVEATLIYIPAEFLSFVEKLP